MDRLSVGQKVKIIKCNSKPNLLGTVCSILSYDEKDDDYELDIPSDDPNKFLYKNLWAYREDLKPVYDGDEASNWSKSAWKPKEKSNALL